MENTSTLIRTILQTQTFFRQAIQRSLRLHNVDITFEMMQILACLWRQAGANQRELAEKTFKDKASLTYLINNLEARGLVVRMEDNEDRRNKKIFLTEKGEAMREVVMPLIDEIYQEVASKMNKKHVEKCTDYLNELNDAFKKIMLTIILLTSSFLVIAQPTHKITINELFSLGIEKSLWIEQSKINEEKTHNQELYTRSSRLPDINIGATGGYLGTPIIFSNGTKRIKTPHWQHNYNVDASQQIYRGGKIKQTIERAAIEREIAALGTELNKADVKLILMGNYLDLLSLYKQKEVLEHNIKEAEVRLHDIRQMRKEGMITQNDVIRSELQLTNYQLSLNETGNNIAIISLQLDIALGLDENTIILPDTTILNNIHSISSYEDYIEQAYRNYPELRIANLDIKISKLDTRIAKSDYLPSLSLRANNALIRPLTTSPVQDVFKNSWNVSLVLSYNLSSLHRNKHKVNIMQNDVSLQQSKREQLTQTIRMEIKSAYIKHQEAIDRISALLTYVGQANENYRIVQNKYLNQLAILTDLLDASNVRLDAELQLTAARANEVYTYYQLLRSTGNL